MKSFTIAIVSISLIATMLAWSPDSRAQAVPLLLEVTFDDASCPDKPGMPGEHWRTSDYFNFTPGQNPCPSEPSVKTHGGWTYPGWDDRIIAAANNPGGGGGKGFRHYRGDGTNTGGGGISIELPRDVTELWGRFYMRYQLGFAWLNGAPHYTKDLYVNVGSPSAWVFGIQGGGSWGIFNGSTSIPSSKSWVSTMGGATGDGKWHCYEWHIQHGSNARIEIWVDGAHVLNTITNMQGTWTRYMAVGENQNSVTGAGATPWYTDYDDFAFSTAGRVGCLSGIPTPQNLRVQ